MAPSYGMAVSIDGPQPAPPALTLVGAARTVPTPNDRWINGAAIWPFQVDLPDVFDPCQSVDSSGHAKSAGTPTVAAEFGAFTVLVPITCTTGAIGNDVAEWQRRATLALEAYEHWGIEREFWTGALKPLNPHLAQPSAVNLNGGTATSPNHAISLLEQEIADKGGNGFIHLRPVVFSLLANAGADITVTNGVARSLLGTPLVPGVGYPGTADDGTAPSTSIEWAYATGPVEIRRSEAFIVPGSIAEATNRAQNLTTFRAERVVLITWDTRIHAAVKIDRDFTKFTA